MIEVKNLTKYYGSLKAVDNISFSIKKGEVVGMLGPNGAGKSTTIRILCCYLDPSAGDVHIDEHSVREDPRRVRDYIGYLAESAPLYSDMMVLDYLRYVLEARGFPKQKIASRIEEIVWTCGLINVVHQNIHELSKGYKQRVGLAHALLGDPQILILDEPTSGLDPNQIIEIRQLIRRIGEQKTVLLSSHILSEVEATCDRVIIINKGRIVADGKTHELHSSMNSGQRVRVEFSAGDPGALRGMLEGISGVREVSPLAARANTPYIYEVFCETGADRRGEIFQAAAQKGFSLVGLHERSENLEDVFRELTTTATSPEAVAAAAVPTPPPVSASSE